MPEGFDGFLHEEPYLLWYLSKMGLKSNVHFKKTLEVFTNKTPSGKFRML